jgi:hypothetical protein
MGTLALTMTAGKLKQPCLTSSGGGVRVMPTKWIGFSVKAASIVKTIELRRRLEANDNSHDGKAT